MNKAEPHKHGLKLMPAFCAAVVFCVLIVVAIQWWRGDNTTFEYTCIYDNGQVCLGGLGDGFGVVTYRSIRIGDMAPQGSPLTYLSDSSAPRLILFFNEETYTVGDITAQELVHLGAKIDESESTEQADVWYILRSGQSLSVSMTDGKPICVVISDYSAYDGSGPNDDNPIWFAVNGSKKLRLPTPHEDIEEELGRADTVYKTRIWLR